MCLPFSALSLVLSNVLLSIFTASCKASLRVGGSLYSCFSIEMAACRWVWLGQAHTHSHITSTHTHTHTHTHSPGDCSLCRWPSSRHSYQTGHSDKAGTRSEGPTPCTGWRHQMDASLDRATKFKTVKAFLLSFMKFNSLQNWTYT